VLCLVGLLALLLFPPFDTKAKSALFNERGIRPDDIPDFYSPTFFWLHILVWACGAIVLSALLFEDLADAVRGVLPRTSTGQAFVLRLRKQAAAGVPAESDSHRDVMRLVLGLPLEICLRFGLFIFFYYVGLKAIDVQGMITGSQSFLRPGVFLSFSHSSEFFSVSFFNNVSFVGEFTTVQLRNWWDATFVVLNVVARFFAVFLVSNTAFLRLSTISSRPQASEAGENKKLG
jgi:hypothetical protein